MKYFQVTQKIKTQQTILKNPTKIEKYNFGQKPSELLYTWQQNNKCLNNKYPCS